MKNIIKRTAAAALSALVLCGGIPSSLSGIPVFENALTAEAATATGSATYSDGVLTLSGAVTKEQILKYQISYSSNGWTAYPIVKVCCFAGYNTAGRFDRVIQI